MSRISFFNKTVFKRNLHGYWPLWAVYLGSLLLIIPIPLYTNLRYGYFVNAADVTEFYFGTALTASLVIGAFFAIFAAMALFSYMYTPRSANMIASLPVRREALFGTNVITILFITVASHVITAIVTVFTITACHSSFLYITPILQWLLLGTLMTFFFICLSCFCATLTGSLLILPCIYGVINFSVILINSILSYIFAEFLYGYSSGSIPEIVIWLTPSVNLLNITTNTYSIVEGATYVGFHNIPEIVVYTIAGIIFLAVAFLIHRARRTESASDIITVKPLKPVIKYFFAGVGSLTIGIVINELLFPFSTGDIVGYSVSMIIGGFVGYFAAEMLVSKSFRVWHKWKGFVIYCVAVILFITGLAFDVTGFETCIPRTKDIEYAYVDIYSDVMEGSDEEIINTITTLHEYIIENRDKEIDYDDYVASVEIVYELNNGSYIQRNYHCNLPDFIVDSYNTPQLCYERIKVSDEFTITDIVQSSIEYYDGEEWQVVPITEDQYHELYNCMLQDIGTSSIGMLSFGVYTQDAFAVQVEFEIREYDGYYYYYQNIPVDAQNSVAYLKSLGIKNIPYN